MFKKIQYGIALLVLPLFLISMEANASYGNCRTSAKIVKGDMTAPLCDISFTAIPTFSCQDPLPQTGVFSIRNNSPVTLNIGPATIVAFDGGATAGTAITANTCGSSLAPGASCNITVTLSAPPFTRRLRIGVDTRQVELLSPFIEPTVGCVATPGDVSDVFPCDLGSTSTYGVLAGSEITNTGPTTINGDLGLYPGTSVTGFPPGRVTGVQNINNIAAAQAKTDLEVLYNCLAEEECGTTIGDEDQAGKTYNATGLSSVNVFCSSTSIENNGTLTLHGDANSVFIFQAGSTLLMGSDSRIVLTGGLTAANVFWQVGSSATLGTFSIFQGTIVALTSITLNTQASILGRALARNGAVTFDNNFVNLPN